MIVVTGAASGIGAALARTLVARGERVAGLDRGEGAFVTHRVDLSDAEAIPSVASELDGVAGLAHVAGLPGTKAPADIFAVNSHAPYRLTKAIAPGADVPVVIVGSVTADRADRDAAEAVLRGEVPDVPGKQAYEISKLAAKLQMLRLLGEGYRANLVAPGPVRTPILADFEQSIGAEHLDRAASLTGGHGEPEAVADVIAFLLSPASRWVRGQVVKADGGLHGLREAAALETSGWR